MGLSAFKALGGAYAVSELIRKEGSQITIATATDGNHGRSVAWGAQQAKVPCKIFVHKDVSESRIKAIEKYGAQVTKVDGNYDVSVDVCKA